jgi:hypothetical protein
MLSAMCSWLVESPASAIVLATYQGFRDCINGLPQNLRSLLTV